MRTYAERNWGDCSDAIAYSLNFVQMCYRPDNARRTEYFNVICATCENEEQVKSFEFRKSDFSKKDYFVLDYYCFGVSEQLKKDMLEFGLIEENFRPIYTRNHDVVLGYQLVTNDVLPPVFEVNGKYEFSNCEVCGHKTYEVYDEIDGTQVYGGLGYPVFLTAQAAENLKDINCLYEDNDEILISCGLYDFLIERYPRLECRPVFLGSIYEDKEYLRLTKNK